MMVLPEYWEHPSNLLSSPTKILSPQRSASPSANRYQHVTTRFSTGSSGSHRSNYSTLARRNVKISITDYPKFSGKARDWQTFDRKFNSVATQGYAYILASEECQPTSEEDKEIYQEDKSYIYDALSLAWADAPNYHIVEQFAKNKDGRKVYLAAKKYFRGEAVEDSLLLSYIHEVVNTKLAPTTFSGAEGYNNKFNDAINNIEQLGYHLDDKILKCLYLSNIQDKTYDTIKDQTTLPTLSLQDTQSLILKKYLTSMGDRRPVAPRYTARRTVNALQTLLDQVVNDSPDEERESPPEEEIHQIFATQSSSPKKTPSGFPLIPSDLYKALPDEVKAVLLQQKEYYHSQLDALKLQKKLLQKKKQPPQCLIRTLQRVTPKRHHLPLLMKMSSLTQSLILMIRSSPLRILL
jgi:hypothetical protein